MTANAATFIQSLSPRRQEAFLDAVNERRDTISNYVQKMEWTQSLAHTHACGAAKVMDSELLETQLRFGQENFLKNLNQFGAKRPVTLHEIRI